MNSVRGDTRTGPARPQRRSRREITAIVILVLAAAWLVAFIVSNSQQVDVSFVFGHVTLSLVWVMIICAVLGALLAAVIPRVRRRSRYRRR